MPAHWPAPTWPTPKKDGFIKDGVVSISCLATCNAPTDTTIWTGRARTDGTFTVTGLQTGDYSVAFWDETQSYIMTILQYSVVGDPVPSQAALPAVTSAVRSTTLPRTFTLNFASNPNVLVNSILTLTGGNNGWAGTFRVSSIVTATSIRVVRTSPAGSPGASATVQPVATKTVFTNPPATDMADVLLPGWFTDLQGHIFNDLNGDALRNECRTDATGDAAVPTCAALVADPTLHITTAMIGQYKSTEGNVVAEPGIADFGLTERTRGNSLQDQGAAIATTNDAGEFDLSQGYPLGQFLIAEAYNPRFKNTGFTYTTDNDLNTDGSRVNHTVQTAQVDVNFLPVIGLSATLDWGVQAYGTGTDYWSGDTTVAAPKNENGGIVGTVTYDVTRNEFDPAYSAQEDYQPGVSGIPMQLWKTKKDANGKLIKTPTGAAQQVGISKSTGVACDRPDASRGTNAVTDTGQDCKPYDYYVTESWTRPTGCTALDVNGNELAGEMALPDHLPKATVDYSHTDPNQPECIEAPMSGFQIGGEGTVDGNYALTSLISPATITGAPAAGGAALEQVYADSQNNAANSAPLTSGDYIVEAVNPVDTVNAKVTHDPTNGGYVPAAGAAKHLYRFTDETAINVMSGDTYVPQDGFGSSGDAGGSGYSVVDGSPKVRQDKNSLGAGTVAKCVGQLQTLPQNTSDNTGLGAVNPDFNAAGGSPYAGETVPVCDAKVVTVVGGRSMNPQASSSTPTCRSRRSSTVWSTTTSTCRPIVAASCSARSLRHPTCRSASTTRTATGS